MDKITFEHQPEKGPFTHSFNFVKHIFGDKWIVGLDYLSELLTKPEIKLLPVILEGQGPRGKTLFATWINELFSPHCEIDYPMNLFLSTFLDDYITIVEEPRMDPEFYYRVSVIIEEQETLKKYPGKFIFTASKTQDKPPSNFWWHIMLPEINGTPDPELKDKLLKEIPAFLFFLETRKIINY